MPSEYVRLIDEIRNMIIEFEASTSPYKSPLKLAHDIINHVEATTGVTFNRLTAYERAKLNKQVRDILEDIHE